MTNKVDCTHVILGTEVGREFSRYDKYGTRVYVYDKDSVRIETKLSTYAKLKAVTALPILIPVSALYFTCRLFAEVVQIVLCKLSDVVETVADKWPAFRDAHTMVFEKSVDSSNNIWNPKLKELLDKHSLE